jgi:undecaprenyl-diphosphatase
MIVSAVYHMTYLQAIVIGLIQGLTELFPISSLGHTVLVPSWIGGTWATLVRQEDSSESPYLAFVVGLHLATALVLLGYYWREWLRIVRGLITSILRLRIESDDERLAWLLVVATIPVGIAGLALEHTFRVLFARPIAAAIFLTLNGGILFLGEHYRRRASGGVAPDAVVAPDARVRRGRPLPETAPRFGAGLATPPAPLVAAGIQPGAEASLPAGRRADDSGRPSGQEADRAAEHRLAGIGLGSALWIGASQILALLAGISREGVTMAGGLVRGLSHEDAMRFSFLLSTPVILAAGVLKIPDLTGPLGADIRGQVIAGSIAAAATSLLAVVFLARYFRTRTLTPFAIYCVVAGLLSIVRFGPW